MRQLSPVDSRVVNNVLVIQILENCVVFPKEVDPVSQAIAELIDAGTARNVVINLNRVRYLSSSALGMLVRTHKQMTGRGKTLRLCGLNAELQDNFQTTQLDRLLDIRDNEEAALAGLC